MTPLEPGSDRTAEALLAVRIGLDPATVGPGAITRAIGVRMSALGLRDREAYLRRLAASEAEQQELIEEIVIPESWFFRDENPFNALRSYVKTRRNLSPALRLLSIPCACGEEPYSIAITLLDLGLSPDRFQIDAVDVSARHLAAAEQGVYRTSSFRGADLSFRDRHFRRNGDALSFTLDPKVRGTVRFTRGNLLDPHLLSGQLHYDVIFCRNVLIYLDNASRVRALAVLDRLLGPEGLLFVGHAERLTIDRSRFEPCGENGSFTLRRATAPEPPKAPSRPLAAAPARTMPVAKPGRVEPAREVPRSLPESSATLLDQAAALADQGRHDEAAARCEAAVARFGPSARAFFLLGLVRQAADRLAEAETCFRKTIYLDPDHEEALLALELIAQRRGDHGAASGHRRRADRARARKGTS